MKKLLRSESILLWLLVKSVCLVLFKLYSLINLYHQIDLHFFIPTRTGAEGPLILYVLGYSWSALRMCLMQGPLRFFTMMWNWAETIMLSLFWLTFFFWMMAAFDAVTNEENKGIVLFTCEVGNLLITIWETSTA